MIVVIKKINIIFLLNILASKDKEFAFTFLPLVTNVGVVIADG